MAPQQAGVQEWAVVFLEALYADKRNKTSIEGIANRWETTIFRNNPKLYMCTDVRRLVITKECKSLDK